MHQAQVVIFEAVCQLPQEYSSGAMTTHTHLYDTVAVL
jgi:hypothetical protein